MTIIEITPELELPPPKTVRSEGVHVSNIIRSIALKVGFLDKKWASDLSLKDATEITDPDSILRIMIGLAWESFLIPTLEGVVDHPGEMHLEGVYLTHDGEAVDRVFSGKRNFELIVYEVKSTYKSARHNIREQWMYLTQLKAYCKALGTRYSRIDILYICGDYTYPIRPCRKVYEVEFTQAEIDASWTMLMDYTNHRLDETVLNTVEGEQ